MKFNYYSETDSLYIDISEKKSVDSLEIKPGIVLDYDENDDLAGIDIDSAKKVAELSKVELADFPVNSIFKTSHPQQKL